MIKDGTDLDGWGMELATAAEHDITSWAFRYNIRPASSLFILRNSAFL